MTTTQTETLEVGTQVEYQGSITLLRGDWYIVASVDAETGLYELIDPWYHVHPLSKVRLASIVVLEDRPQMKLCQCGQHWSEDGEGCRICGRP